jgi:hypothetical protein
MDLSKLSQNQKIAAGGGALALVSMFLPWYGFSFGGFGSASINAWSSGFLAWGGIVLAIAGATILTLKVLEVQDVTVGKLAAEQLALILAAAGVVLIILRWLTETSFVKFGLFIGLVAAAAVAYGAFGAMKDAGLEMPTADDFKSSGDN